MPNYSQVTINQRKKLNNLRLGKIFKKSLKNKIYQNNLKFSLEVKKNKSKIPKKIKIKKKSGIK